MIVSQEFLSKLKQFGLNSYESKLWASLLSRGVSTAGELSDIANVPRSRSYDVLESLERKGFILSKLGKPIKYVAIPPQEVIERVKKKVNQEAKLQEKNLSEIKTSNMLTELNGMFGKGQETLEPHDMNATIKGRNNIYHHIEMSIRNAQKTIVILTTQAGLKRKTQQMKQAIDAAKKRGVKVKMVASDKINSRFVIKDNKEVLMMLTDDADIHESYDVGVWVNSPYFAQTIQTMFDKI